MYGIYGILYVSIIYLYIYICMYYIYIYIYILFLFHFTHSLTHSLTFLRSGEYVGASSHGAAY